MGLFESGEEQTRFPHLEHTKETYMMHGGVLQTPMYWCPWVPIAVQYSGIIAPKKG